MAKYTRQDVQALALAMRNAKYAGKPFALLTGAGCSLSAGIPSADGLLKLLNDGDHGLRLRKALACDNLVGQNYGAVMGKMPLSDRKKFFDPLLKNAKVNWGHIALAGLMKDGFIGRVLTFNFDSILARAAGINGFYPATYDFGVAPSNTQHHLVMPSIIYLHGQGHGAVMKNSAKDTEDHAIALAPLLKNTLDNFGLLVVGYSGLADKVFPKLVECNTNENQVWWCDHSEGPLDEHVQTLFAKSEGSAMHLAGVDFDDLLIALGQELKSFPPSIFTNPSQHLLDEIAPILPPPKSLDSAKGLLEDIKQKLEKWRIDPNSIESRLRILVMKAEYEAAIALKDGVKSEVEKVLLAWAYVGKGNALLSQAQLQFQGDELLFNLSFIKFEEALKIKPDMHEALNGWGGALLFQFHKTNEAGLLVEAESKVRRAEQLSGRASYNLACVLARKGEEDNCQAQLLRCKADGTLPDAAHLKADNDFAEYRDKAWFKDLLA
jgi:hypothetical protein